MAEDLNKQEEEESETAVQFQIYKYGAVFDTSVEATTLTSFHCYSLLFSERLE